MPTMVSSFYCRNLGYFDTQRPEQGMPSESVSLQKCCARAFMLLNEADSWNRMQQQSPSRPSDWLPPKSWMLSQHIGMVIFECSMNLLIILSRFIDLLATLQLGRTSCSQGASWPRGPGSCATSSGNGSQSLVGPPERQGGYWKKEPSRGALDFRMYEETAAGE